MITQWKYYIHTKIIINNHINNKTSSTTSIKMSSYFTDYMMQNVFNLMYHQTDIKTNS